MWSGSTWVRCRRRRCCAGAGVAEGRMQMSLYRTEVYRISVRSAVARRWAATRMLVCGASQSICLDMACGIGIVRACVQRTCRMPMRTRRRAGLPHVFRSDVKERMKCGRLASGCSLGVVSHIGHVSRRRKEMWRARRTWSMNEMAKYFDFFLCCCQAGQVNVSREKE